MFTCKKFATTIAVALATCLFNVMPSHIGVARAYDVGNALHMVYSGASDYRFYNFDFHPASGNCNSTVVASNNADNPVSVIWYGNASQQNVGDLLSNAGYQSYFPSSTECGVAQQVSTGAVSVTSATGNKTQAGCNEPPNSNSTEDHHVRFYGSYYDQSWGYFVIGTVHNDFNDTCADHYLQSFGYQEDAEHALVNDLPNAGNVCNRPPTYRTSDCIANTYPDSQPMGNQQEYTGGSQQACGSYSPFGFYIDGTHCMQSDGNASTFQIS